MAIKKSEAAVKPLRPSEVGKLTESDQRYIARAVELINVALNDEGRVRWGIPFRGYELAEALGQAPNDTIMDELVHIYRKAGWTVTKGPGSLTIKKPRRRKKK